MILISVPVHEHPEVILDQVANFKKFAPDAGVIIHPARQFRDSHQDFFANFHSLPNVWVNPNPFYTRLGMVLKCHISNFIYASKIGIKFTHFTMHSSNDLFVRTGVEDYVIENDYGFFQIDILSNEYKFSYWQEDFHADKAYRKILSAAGGIPTSLASQVEGSFYPREGFEEFARYFMRFAWKELPWGLPYSHGNTLYLVKLFDRAKRSPRWKNYLKGHLYTKEEFYPPNFFSIKCNNPSTPYCFMNWKENLVVTADDIKKIRDGISPLANYNELFTVKRVSRVMDDPIRMMIRNIA